MGACPQVADWDEDGDYDLIVGDALGMVHYYENIGSATDPQLTDQGLLMDGTQTLDVGDLAMPLVHDWDEDGRKDLVIGTDGLTIVIYLNVGTNEAPEFDGYTPIETEFSISEIKISPDIGDLNGDGLKDIAFGHWQGTVIYYPNSGTNPTPVFTEAHVLTADDQIIDPGGWTHMDFDDWDEDGDLDLLFAEWNGEVYLHRNNTSGPHFPIVDIECNGSDGPVTVVNPDPITLDIEVDPRDAVGTPADVWAIVKRGPAFAVYDGSGPMMGWTFPVAYPFTGHALASGPLAGISSTILDTALPPGSYTGFVIIDPLANNRYNATAHNIMDQVDFTVLPAGTELVLVWSPAGSVSGKAMADTLGALGLGYEIETGELPADLGAYAAVFVNLGIYSNNHVLTAAEGDILAAYLDGGGNVYMEGGDTWYYDTPTAAHPYFGITGLSDGGSDTFNCDGIAGTFTEGMSFFYTGENSWMDQLAPVAPAYTIFMEPTVGYDNGIAHDAGAYKTIGASFEFGGLVDNTEPSTKLVLMGQYLDFFGLAE